MSHKHYFEFKSYRPHKERLFENSDLKYVIMDWLKEKPSHGYEIVKSIEQDGNAIINFAVFQLKGIMQTLRIVSDCAGTE